MNNNTTTTTNFKKSRVAVSRSTVSSHQRPSSRNLLRPCPRRDISRTLKRKASRINRPKIKHEVKNAPWTPGDDYLLINSVVMVCNLTEVYHTVRFAVHFTEKEIENRWRDLLFDPIVSSTALKAIEKLPPFMKSQLDRQIPFSSQEDNIIAQIPFSDVYPDGILKSLNIYDLNPSIFTEILRKHPTIFYSGRDELDLYRQWCRFYNCHCIAVQDRCVKSKSTSDDYTSLLSTTSINVKTSTTSTITTTNRDNSTSSLNDNNCANPIALGGDPQSFSDTELLLEETVTNAIASGIPKLTEQSTVTRRQHMLNQTSYHGFQGLVTQSVLEALLKESSSQLNDSAIHSSPLHHHSSPSSSIASSNTRGTPGLIELKSSNSVNDQSHSSLLTQEPSKSRALFPCQPSSTPPVLSSNQEFDLKRRLELHRRRGRLWARLRRTKEEARRWTRLVEMCVADGAAIEIMDLQPIYPALASLTGSRTQFLIKEKKVIFGRSSFVYQPDIDLSMEGGSARISRCHGQIRLSKDGIFWLGNFSSHTVYVDGNPILTDEEVELKDLATILIDHITLRFDVNHDYVDWLCSNDNTTTNITSCSSSSSSSSYTNNDKSHKDDHHKDNKEDISNGIKLVDSESEVKTSQLS
ncbi:Microspherule protein isoform 2 [Schistosoma japonicum]|uniref:Microspherule protein isoform 2 n=2 Tax=Schistosoma japonicum TaxID=6182 RepID=A0A4Z2DKU8_SCHJA|nr:Microspherule protein 1 [Schistosoma japonicum]TNN17123.1 Microspherule protein isoform 2 [Schistosoma japonicum]